MAFCELTDLRFVGKLVGRRAMADVSCENRTLTRSGTWLRENAESRGPKNGSNLLWYRMPDFGDTVERSAVGIFYRCAERLAKSRVIVAREVVHEADEFSFYFGARKF